MLKIENWDVVGWEHAIHSMRNPMNSWAKSDSDLKCIDGCEPEFVVGPSDLDLMRRLAMAGTDHRKFMRMIVVYADITAPRYWNIEADTYKVGTVTNSCSTMHKIMAKEFTLDDFSHEHLIEESIVHLHGTIDLLNDYRDWYLKYDSMSDKDKAFFPPDIKSKKDLWWQIIQLLPQSYNQKRTMMLNYEVLTNMYHSRKNHKLDEWHTFCDWVETLPYSELIAGKPEVIADGKN